MDAFSQDALMQTWKRQLDASFRLIEALTESAERMHETQLEAAADAHADAVATQQAALKAASPAELAELQLRWTRSNAEKAIAYWRAVYDNAVQTSTQLAACLGQTNQEGTKQ